MSLTPKDMDFMEAKHAAAREIALAFGVPPMLLAIPPDFILFCGLALGREDPDAPINQWRAPREPVDAFASFSGFDS